LVILDKSDSVRPRAGADPAHAWGAFFLLKKLNHISTNTGVGSTTSAPRGGDIKDKEREVRAGRSQGSRPSGVPFWCNCMFSCMYTLAVALYRICICPSIYPPIHPSKYHQGEPLHIFLRSRCRPLSYMYVYVHLSIHSSIHPNIIRANPYTVSSGRAVALSRICACPLSIHQSIHPFIRRVNPYAFSSGLTRLTRVRDRFC